MNSPIAVLATAVAAVAIVNLAYKWEMYQQEQQFQLEKRDAVIEALERQPRQQVIVNNQNNGIAGKQGR